jgi:hypothetical protein
MEHTFELMGRRLPYDMPGFLADGMRQADTESARQTILEWVSAFSQRSTG